MHIDINTYVQMLENIRTLKDADNTIKWVWDCRKQGFRKLVTQTMLGTFTCFNTFLLASYGTNALVRQNFEISLIDGDLRTDLMIINKTIAAVFLPMIFFSGVIVKYIFSDAQQIEQDVTNIYHAHQRDDAMRLRRVDNHRSSFAFQLKAMEAPTKGG